MIIKKQTMERIPKLNNLVFPWKVIRPVYIYIYFLFKRHLDFLPKLFLVIFPSETFHRFRVESRPEAADARARGFLLGATAGRTTLNGEGLQHQDGQKLEPFGTGRGSWGWG